MNIYIYIYIYIIRQEFIIPLLCILLPLSWYSFPVWKEDYGRNLKLYPDVHYTRVARNFEICRNHLKLLGARKIIWSRIHTEDLQIFGATTRNLVAASWRSANVATTHELPVVMLEHGKIIFEENKFLSSLIFMCVISVVCVTNKKGSVVKQHN